MFAVSTLAMTAVVAKEQTELGDWHTGRRVLWSEEAYLNVINYMAVGNDGYAYIAADAATLYVTADHAEHWVEKHVPVSGLLNKVYANDAGAVVVVRNAGQYAWSTDHAENWDTEELGDDEKVQEVGFVADRNDVIWIQLLTDRSRQRKPGKLILRTTSDGGKSWEPDHVVSILFDRIIPSNAMNAWGRHGGEIYATSDGGKNWTKETEAGLKPGEVVARTEATESLVVLFLDSGRVLEYVKEKKGWQELEKIQASSKISTVLRIGAGRWVAVSTHYEIFQTSDLHQPWALFPGAIVNRWTQLAGWRGQEKIINRTSDGPVSVFDFASKNETQKLEAPLGEPRSVALSEVGGKIRATMITSANQVLSASGESSSWKVVRSEQSVGPLAMDESGWGILVTSGHIVETTSDGGLKWEKMREVPGTVTRVLVGSGHRALVEVRSGPSWSATYGFYRLRNGVWDQVPGRPDIQFFSWSTPDTLVGIDDKGSFTRARMVTGGMSSQPTLGVGASAPRGNRSSATICFGHPTGKSAGSPAQMMHCSVRPIADSIGKR
jgi:photosystem II stability/assembly factor-like uncharacterized protein